MNAFVTEHDHPLDLARARPSVRRVQRLADHRVIMRQVRALSPESEELEHAIERERERTLTLRDQAEAGKFKRDFLDQLGRILARHGPASLESLRSKTAKIDASSFRSRARDPPAARGRSPDRA